MPVIVPAHTAYNRNKDGIAGRYAVCTQISAASSAQGAVFHGREQRSPVVEIGHGTSLPGIVERDEKWETFIC